MTLKQVAGYANEIRDRWHLGHWELQVAWGEKAEMEGLCGYIAWQIEYHKASIVLKKGMPLGDLQHTIIHEMLHLRLEGHKDKPKKYDAQYEAALNILAKNL